MQDTRGRFLFRTGAIFNWVAGFAILFMPQKLADLAGFPPAGVASVYGQIACAAVILFGWAYWMVARDHRQYRPYITLGIIGKALIVILLYGNWLVGNIPFTLAGVSTVDAIYIALFTRFYVQTRTPDESVSSAAAARAR